MARRAQIDDRETPIAETDRTVNPAALVVGASMGYRGNHRVDRRGRHCATVEPNQACDTAHG